MEYGTDVAHVLRRDDVVLYQVAGEDSPLVAVVIRAVKASDDHTMLAFIVETLNGGQLWSIVCERDHTFWMPNNPERI